MPALSKPWQILPYSCIVHKPETDVYESYKNIGRKYTIIDRHDTIRPVQRAIDALSAGQSLFIKSATYNLGGTPLTFPFDKEIAIIGEMYESMSALGAAVKGCPFFTYGGTDYAFKSTGYVSGDDQGGLILKNLGFYLNHYQGNNKGIYLHMLSTVDIQAVHIKSEKIRYAGSLGFKIESPTAEHSKISDLHVSCFDVGIHIKAPHIVGDNLSASFCNTGSDIESQNITLLHPHAAGCVNRGFVLRYAQITLVSPQVEGITSATGIGIEFTNPAYTYCVIDPYFTNMAGGSKEFGGAGVGANCEVVGKRISDGYKFKNYGTATILDTQSSVQFAHGLISTPTVVVLGATHAEVADAIWSADATNITITVPSAVTADRDISWKAEV